MRAAADAILITRPEPGATETARRVAALGWQPVLAPALILTPCPTVAPAGAQALLLPSTAAIEAAAAAAPPGLPTFAVGEATAAVARQAGLRQAIGAAGDATALAALVAARLRPAGGPLWLAVGESYGAELATLLRARGFAVESRVAYAATAAPTLPEAARTSIARGAVVAVLFFSPRTAECAITLLRSAGLLARTAAMAAIALSPRVAEAACAALRPLGWAAVHVAERPDQDSLLERLRELGQPKARDGGRDE